MAALPNIFFIRRLSHLNHQQACLLSSQVAQTSSCRITPSQAPMPRRGGTSILLLHNGQPRTPFYLRHHLVEQLKNDFYLPNTGLERLCKVLYSRKAKLLERCLNNCSRYPPLAESLQKFGLELEKAVNKVLPEFGPARCTVSLLHDEGGVEEKFQEVLSRPYEDVAIVSLYPFHNPHHTTPLLQAVHKFLQTNTTKVKTKFIDDGDSKENSGFYISKGNKPVSFNCIILDKLVQSEAFVQFWAEKILNELESNVDGLVFAVPMPLSSRSAYIKSVEETAERVMYTIYKSYPQAVPWRIAFFQSWNSFWPVLSQATLKNQLADLRKKRGSGGRVLVVPIANFLDDFDTQTVLPTALEQMENTKLMTAASMTSPMEGKIQEKMGAIGSSKALVHSLTEVLKSNLLSVRSSAEW